jgi:hypothetical protein
MTLRKLPPRKVRDPAEFESFVPKPRKSSQHVALPGLNVDWLRRNGGEAYTVPRQKVQGRKSQDIRDSARGEECTVRIAGVCRGGTEHTIWSHAPLGAAGKGRSIKSLDLAGAYCCTACDAALDQAQRPPGMTREQVLLDWFFGHMRSLVRLAQKGLLR